MMIYIYNNWSHSGIRADFLENEAELSGSDFNSGDEADDSGDDALEEEEGDKEHFDANELRDQVRLIVWNVSDHYIFCYVPTNLFRREKESLLFFMAVADIYLIRHFTL